MFPEATVPQRPGEEIDAQLLLSHLRRHLPDLPERPLEIRQFPTGASNLTYWIRIGDWQAVLRRPPNGPVPPKAHDMVREGHLLERLHPVYPLAPRPLHVCPDPSIIGVPFHVMEFRPGVVLDARFPPGFEPTADSCGMIARHMVETLVALHEVDYTAAGLGELGFPEGFLERQVTGWVARFDKARTEEISAAGPLIEHLRSAIPATPEHTVIHNDFKLNNLLLDPDTLDVTAVLDWEMATIGDPLFDFAVCLGYWVDPEDPEALRAVLPGVSGHSCFPRRSDLIELYGRLSGRDVSDLNWYQTFAYFKLAVILQQIYARWVRGQTEDQRFSTFGASVRALIEHAASLRA